MEQRNALSAALRFIGTSAGILRDLRSAVLPPTEQSEVLLRRLRRGRRSALNLRPSSWNRIGVVSRKWQASVLLKRASVAIQACENENNPTRSLQRRCPCHHHHHYGAGIEGAAWR